MPTYSYRCTECANAFDIHQAFTDDSLTECPVCGGKLRKVFTAIGVSFNGSGFYRNDSRAPQKEGASSDSGSSSSEGSKSDGGSKSDKGSGEKSGTKEKSGGTNAGGSGSSSGGSGSGSGGSGSGSGSRGVAPAASGSTSSKATPAA